MTLSDLCIRRPVLATVMSLVILLVGVVSFQRLTVREYPNIDVPVVSIETRYPGATAEIIESQVTRPLENALSGIEGVDVMSSSSRAELSQINVRFRVDRDPDGAAADVRDRVARSRGALPLDIEEPVVAKTEADAQPMVWAAVTSTERDSLELTDLAERVIRDRLASLPGISNVTVFAGRRYAMRIWLDFDRLAARGLTVADVETALRRQNVQIPAGRIESRDREFTVLSKTDLRTPEQFGAVIVDQDGTSLVRLRDVARVELGAADERSVARLDGKASIAIGIVRQSTANPLAVAQAVKEELPGIRAALPDDVNIDIGYDTTLFIDASIKAVYESIGEAVALVVVVIFLFLRSWRASLIPLVTIPVSLVGAFAMLYAFGFSINVLTLLALVLAIGLVVDDAIVMLENIYRYVEQGMSPREAAFKGSREIGFAIVAMTLTLAAVFAPIAFTEGRTGKLFVEFALALAGAVIVSGFVALTLSPMMCAKLLRHETNHGRLWQWGEQMLERLTSGYRRRLEWGLDRMPLVLGVAAATFVAGVLLYRALPQELAPAEDRGLVIGIVRSPQGSTIAYTDARLRELERVWASVPERVNTFSVAGFPIVTEGFSPIIVRPWDERTRSTQEIAAEAAPRLFAVPGAFVIPLLPASLGQPFVNRPVEVVLQTTGSYAELEKIGREIEARLAKVPGLVFPESGLELNKPQLEVIPDREKVASIGADVETVGRTLETLFGSRRVTRFERGSDQYDVILQAEAAQRATPSDLSRAFVRDGSGGMVPLSNLIRVEETVAAPDLTHFNKLRSATIEASLAPGYSLGEALEVVEQTVRDVAGDRVQLDYNGSSREFRESGQQLAFTFVLAIVFIYLVLAAQFESWIDPFVILLSVPLALTGGLAAQQLTGGTLNIYSQIGLITLVGLISKHGILIVDVANQLRDAGLAARAAIIEAGSRRLRPILMTTGAMVFGAIPLALATGAGAEARRQIGAVIVGGLTFGTLLTLFVVPAVYLLLAGREQRHTGVAEPAAA